MHIITRFPIILSCVNVSFTKNLLVFVDLLRKLNEINTTYLDCVHTNCKTQFYLSNCILTR